MKLRTVTAWGVLAILAPSCGGGGGGGSGGIQPPPAPIGVVAAAGIGQVTISWTAVLGAISYNVYRATVPGITRANFGVLAGGAQLVGVNSPFQNMGLVSGVTYYFVVTAINAGGESSESIEVSATPNPFVPGVAFIEEKDTAGLPELYIADVLGTIVSKRSGTMAPGASGASISGGGWMWSADDQYLAYLAQQDTPGVRELYVVPTAGGVPVKVSPVPMVAGGNVGLGFRWSPIGHKLAFLADATTDTVNELYVVDADGSGRVKVSGTVMPGGTGVVIFDWSPNATRLAYLATQDSATDTELYSVMADGTNRTKVSNVLPGTSAGNFEWSPDSNRIGYGAQQETLTVWGVYTVRPDGSQNVRVNGAVGPGLNASADFGYGFGKTWSLDSTRIVYQVGGGGTSKEMHVGNADGSGSTRIDNPLSVGQQIGNTWSWAPDNSRVAYIADETTNNIFELYTVLPNGTGRLKISAAFGPGGTIESGPSPRFFWTMDSARIGYWGPCDTPGVRELFVARPDTANSGSKISGTVFGSGVTGVQHGLSSQFVLFHAQGETAGTYDFYSVPRDGGPRVKISPLLAAGGDTFSSVPMYSVNRVVFRVKLSASAKTEVYSALIDGTSTLKVSGTPPVGAGVTGVATSN